MQRAEIFERYDMSTDYKRIHNKYFICDIYNIIVHDL